MKKSILLFLIIVWIGLTLFIRLYGLEKSPQTIGFDEAALGYNAYSILLTGKDEYGTPHPLSLRSFNDFKPALYSYIALPFIKYIGLNQTSTRAPSAILGTISLIFLLLIFKQLSKTTLMTSLGVLIIISFLPWRLHFSRVALEANIAMAFFTGTIWFLLNFNKNILYKIGVVLFSTLAIYSYHSTRLAIPTLLILFFINQQKLTFKGIYRNLWPLFLVAILCIPIFIEFNTSLLLTRFSQTNIFTHFYPFTPSELIFMPNVWVNLVGHPLYYLGAILSGHVFAYLSPKNISLLIYPGVIKSAQAISGIGMVGFLGGLFFIIGLLSNLKDFVFNKERRLIVYWIIAGILPAALTWEWFYPLRSLNVYPALDIICGFGILTIFKYCLSKKHRILKYLFALALTLIIISSSVYNVLNEYNYSAWETKGEFQPGGFKEGSPLLLSLKDSYSTVFIDSNQAQSYEILWFYMKYSPFNIQKIASTRNLPGRDGPPGVNFDNFIYKKFDWPHDKYKNNFVYWTNSEVKVDEIAAVSGTKLYKILSPDGNWIASIITKP